MTDPLDLRVLHDWCGSDLPDVGGDTFAASVVRALGPIAPLWLEPHVLDRAHAWHCEMVGEPRSPRPRPDRLVQRGQIGLLLATARATSLPLLRSAFVLPVEWRRGGRSSPRLPEGLVAFADRVLHDVGVRGLSLHVASWLERAGADFSRFSFSPDSAWAALGSGAVVASQGGATRPDVLVSAAWTHDGPTHGWIAKVDRVEAKLDAALAAGARVVLLPRENAAESAAWLARHPHAGLEIRHLSNVPGAPQRVLSPVLHALEAAPSRAAGATFEERSDYYVRMAEDGHNDYYRDELVTEVVARMRPQVDADARLRDVGRLVIIASKSWSLGTLLVGLFDPRDVLVLHDGGLDAATHILLETLPSFGRAGGPDRTVRESTCRPGETFAADVAAALTAFAERGDGGRMAVDLTAGYRDFHFAVLAALPPHAEVVFVHAPQDRRHARVRPGTERLRRLVIPGR